jgi:hypothetical protein
VARLLATASNEVPKRIGSTPALRIIRWFETCLQPAKASVDCFHRSLPFVSARPLAFSRSCRPAAVRQTCAEPLAGSCYDYGKIYRSRVCEVADGNFHNRLSVMNRLITLTSVFTLSFVLMGAIIGIAIDAPYLFLLRRQNSEVVGRVVQVEPANHGVLEVSYVVGGRTYSHEFSPDGQTLPISEGTMVSVYYYPPDPNIVFLSLPPRS